MKYNKGKWSQGHLLINSNTRRWSEQEKRRVDDSEKVRVFANFYGMDEGRSRVGICVCTNPETAEGDAERIAACVNACAGITTEALNMGVVKGCMQQVRSNSVIRKYVLGLPYEPDEWMGVPVYEEVPNEAKK